MRTHTGVVVVTALYLLSDTSAFAVPLLEIVAPDDEWSSPAGLTLGGSHDIAETRQRFGWYGANLMAVADVALTYTFLGKEAAWPTVVLAAGVPVLFDTSTPADQAGGSAVANAWVDFTIKTLLGGTQKHKLHNGQNTAPGDTLGKDLHGEPSFWLAYADEDHTAVYVAFDDGGGVWNGRGNDLDYDDFVFKISAVSVPEPSTWSLLGMAALLAGLAHRRRFAPARKEMVGDTGIEPVTSPV